MRLFYLILLLLYGAHMSFGQFDKPKEPKELFELLKKSNLDSSRANIMYELAHFYFQSCNCNGNNKLDSAQYFLKQALSIYVGLGNKKKIADVTIEIADINFNSKRYVLAEKQLLSLLEMKKMTDSTRLCDIYYLLSAINRYSGNFNSSLSYSTKCVEHMEGTKDTIKASLFYGELALLYDAIGKTDKSIVWYRKALGKREQYKSDPVHIYRTAYFLSNALIKERRGKEAILEITSLTRRLPPIGEDVNAILSQTLANCYSSLKQFNQAEKYYQKMVKILDQQNIHNEEYFISMFDVGKFYVQLKQFKSGGYYLKQILNNADLTISKMKDTHQLLFQVDSASGNYLLAIDHLKQFKLLNDSIFNETKSWQIEELQIQYHTTQKEQNINLLEKEKKIEQDKLIQEKYTRNWILGGVVLLLIIMALLINYSHLKQRTNKKLELIQKEISEQNNSLHNLVNEKDWLVKEIHHRVKNNFHTVMGLLGTQSGYLKNEEAIAAMAESQQRIQAMSLIHQKLYQSENMSDIDMADYIHELVDYLKDALNTGRRIQFHFRLDNINLGLYYALPVGLILNETITNAIKYAFPENRNGNIHISFTADYNNENSLLLAVTDDGTGLPISFDNNSNGTMGMNLMKGLARDIDGQFTIYTGAGTTVKIAFNYHREIQKNHKIAAIETQKV